MWKAENLLLANKAIIIIINIIFTIIITIIAQGCYWDLNRRLLT